MEDPFTMMDLILSNSQLTSNGIFLHASTNDIEDIKCILRTQQTPYFPGYEFQVSSPKKEILVFKPLNFSYEISDSITINNITHQIDGIISDDSSVVVFSVVQS
jgi:hypothetical protein